MARMRVQQSGLGNITVHYRNDSGGKAHVQLFGAQIVDDKGRVLFTTPDGIKTLEQAGAITAEGGVDLTVLSRTSSLPGDTELRIRPAGEGPVRAVLMGRSDCGAILGEHLVQKRKVAEVSGLSELRFSQGAASARAS